MCSIFQLAPGFNIPEELLFNALHNNEHGYGILLKEDKEISIIKDMPEKVDPDKVFKILEDNKDVERWVHLRNKSEGDVSINNVQPIPIFSSKKRSLYFLHNGTIYTGLDIPPNQQAFIPEVLSKAVDSDSRRFALGKLAPIFARFQGQHGFGDLTDPFLQEYLTKLWPTGGGRAVIVSSDQDPLIFNSSGWEKIKTKDGDFLASNNDYFEKITRGTLFEQRKKEEDKKKGNVPKVQGMYGRNGVKPSGLYELTYPPFDEAISLSENIVNILEEFDLFNDEGFIAMSFLEATEVKKLFEDNLEDAVTMFMYLTNMLKDSVNEVNEKDDLLKAANARIQNLIANSWDRPAEEEEEVHVG